MLPLRRCVWAENISMDFYKFISLYTISRVHVIVIVNLKNVFYTYIYIYVCDRIDDINIKGTVGFMAKSSQALKEAFVRPISTAFKAAHDSEVSVCGVCNSPCFSLSLCLFAHNVFTVGEVFTSLSHSCFYIPPIPLPTLV
jgi:hypothetical protein